MKVIGVGVATKLCARCESANREFMAEAIRTGKVAEPPEPCDECKAAAKAVLEDIRPVFPWWARMRKRVFLDGVPSELLWMLYAFVFGVSVGAKASPGFLAGAKAVGLTLFVLWLAMMLSGVVEWIARRLRRRRLAAKDGSE